MVVDFTKMHGAGNDFIVINDRRQTIPWTDVPLMAAIASRRSGIGCEGIILIQPPPDDGEADFRMHFLNPDGHPADMCGNGARCAALYAWRNGLAGRQQLIKTGQGEVQAEILAADPPDGTVRITTQLPAPAVTREVEAAGANWTCHSLDTGVPHAVIFVDDAAAVNVREVGRALREHSTFAPAGTNVNFAQVEADGRLRLRTYERGVEDETGACGTGALATALAAEQVLQLELPLTLLVTSGDTLVVGVESDPDGGRVPTLTGPAREVYQGSIDLAWFGAAQP